MPGAHPVGQACSGACRRRRPRRPRDTARLGTPRTPAMPSTISMILRVGLEQLGGDGQTCCLTARVAPRTAPLAHRRRPAAPGTDGVERRQPGVAVHDPDRLEGHAELVGRDLGQGRLVALAVGRLAGEHHEGAVGLEPGPGPLARRRRSRVWPANSGGPGAFSMKMASPMPRYRPCARARRWRSGTPPTRSGRGPRSSAWRTCSPRPGDPGAHGRRDVLGRRGCAGGARRGRAPSSRATRSNIRSRAQVSTAHGPR